MLSVFEIVVCAAMAYIAITSLKRASIRRKEGDKEGALAATGTALTALVVIVLVVVI